MKRAVIYTQVYCPDCRAPLANPGGASKGTATCPVCREEVEYETLEWRLRELEQAIASPDDLAVKISRLIGQRTSMMRGAPGVG